MPVRRCCLGGFRWRASRFYRHKGERIRLTPWDHLKGGGTLTASTGRQSVDDYLLAPRYPLDDAVSTASDDGYPGAGAHVMITEKGIRWLPEGCCLDGFPGYTI